MDIKMIRPTPARPFCTLTLTRAEFAVIMNTISATSHVERTANGMTEIDSNLAHEAYRKMYEYWLLSNGSE